MDKLLLPAGLTIMGGEAEMEKTKFALKWANHLAKSRKVLYLNWGCFEERFFGYLSQIGDPVNQNLAINSQYENLDIINYIDLFNIIDNNDIEVIFIDDLYLSNHNQLVNDFNTNEDLAIATSLRFLAEQLKVKVVLIINVKYNIIQGKSTTLNPSIRDFGYSKEIKKHADQIYHLNHPYAEEKKYARKHTADYNAIEVFSLKNRDRIETVIHFDNTILNIF